MLPRWHAVLLAGAVGLGLWLGSPNPARAQDVPPTPPLPQHYYYPYYYFPWNYWPATTAWPEKPGQPTQPPPAYMAYPPFREPNWHYYLWQPMPYYRGFHFWLDQF
ncbi:MAG TPA: hypothetical protein VFA18_13685 [Gemmataceae bacterium]|nr:hypothetical protein [Gemmataceae bacterium]